MVASSERYTIDFQVMCQNVMVKLLVFVQISVQHQVPFYLIDTYFDTEVCIRKWMEFAQFQIIMVKGQSETADLYPNYLKTSCLMVAKLATRVGDPYCVLGHSVKVKLLVFISSVIQTIIQEQFVWKLAKLETVVDTRKLIIIIDFQVLCSKSRSILNLENEMFRS